MASNTSKSFKEFAKKLERYVTRDVKKAGVTSINRAMASTKTLAVKTAAEELGVPQKSIKTRIGQFKATFNRPSGAVISFAKPISLSAFDPKFKTVNTKKGKRTGATVRGPEGRYLVPGAFIVETKSSRLSVFARVGQARLPIKKLFTNALIKVMSRSNVMRELQGKAKVEFDKNFRHEVKRRGLSDSD